MTDFKELLLKAKEGELAAVENIFKMYRPLLIKNSLDHGIFDEDLYQELSQTFLSCISKFNI